MIKLFIFSLLAIVLALLVTLYLGFPADPGYLLLAFGNYTFETSLFALLVAGAIIYLLIRILLLVWASINPIYWIRYGRHIRDKRNAKARSKTVDGLLYFTRGNWQSAYNLLNGSRNDADASVINHLAAAYAAFEMDDKESWSRLLNDAEKNYPSAKSTINYLRALLLYKSDQLEQCLAVLEKLKKTSLNDAPLLRLMKEVYVRLEEWTQLEVLLPTLEKLDLVDADELERINARLFMEHLYAAGKNSQASANPEEAVAAMAKVWKKAPNRYKDDEKVVKHYVDLLCSVNAQANAVKVMEATLSRNWSDLLVLRYGEQEYGCSHQQLLHAEGWLKARPANANLFLTLGRLSLRNELWGKAKEYYEASIRIAPSTAAYGELSRLLQAMGDIKASEAYLKKYGELIGADLTDLPLPKTPMLTLKSGE